MIEVPAGARWSRQIATETCARIAREAPPNLAAWLPRLEAVGAADAELTETLLRLEEHPGGDGLGGLVHNAKAAANRLVAEWARAAKRWKDRGRPLPPTAQAA